MSRELDAQVAEKVMGWAVFTDTQKPDWDDLITSFPCLVLHDEGGQYLLQDSLESKPWSPSTSIEAAWEVAEVFKRRQERVIVDGEDWYDGGEWRCRIQNVLGDNLIGEARAATAPMAICLAALKAVSPLGDATGRKA